MFFPAWVNMRFAIDADPWTVRIGPRLFNPEEPALFGPTSRSGYVDTGSGALIGIGFTPMGWARLFARDASRFADRVSPLAEAIGHEANELSAALREQCHPPEIFDAWLCDRLTRSEPEPELVAQVLEQIGDPGVTTVATLAANVGMAERLLERFIRRNFGFTPKLLLRRGRFLRALMKIQGLERGTWSSAVSAAGYYDQSHFLRDCRLFLGMPLSKFTSLPKPIAAASLRLRAQALGAPIQALHRVF